MQKEKMNQSAELMLPMDNILFGTEAVILPEHITDEMKNNDRYDCYSADGAYHNEAFCRLCDMLKFPVKFHELNEYHFSVSGKEKAEIIVYHSQEDYNTFIAFDVWWGRTDEHGMIHMGISCKEEIWNEVSGLLDIIAEDCFPFSECSKKVPSELIESLLSGYHDKCLFKEREYIVRHIS